MNRFAHIAVLVTLCSLSSHAMAKVIYQAFNEPFRRISNKVEELADLGYTHIQISPPQKSIDQEIWWARYQPIDLQVIEGPLGNESDLKHLIWKAGNVGIGIIVDVVLNHMADPVFYRNDLQYPEFSWRDFHHHDSRPCITNFQDRYQVTHFWLCDPERPNRRLPDLDTSSDYVRQVQAKYLNKLIGLGVAGFRIDAAKHIEPEYFRGLRSRLKKNNVFIYGEVIGENMAESGAYTPHLMITDFHLLRTMLSAFSMGGSLEYLIHPEAYGAALGGQHVLFARNHDTVMHDNFFNFADYTDAMLAQGFILARGVGVPMVYRDDYRHSLVRYGIQFRHAMEGKRTMVYRAQSICAGCDNKNLLFITRGDEGLAIINKSGEWQDADRAVFNDLQPGCYKDIQYGTRMQLARGGDGRVWVNRWGDQDRGGFAIGPRTILYFKPCR